MERFINVNALAHFSGDIIIEPLLENINFSFITSVHNIKNP